MLSLQPILHVVRLQRKALSINPEPMQSFVHPHPETLPCGDCGISVIILHVVSATQSYFRSTRSPMYCFLHIHPAIQRIYGFVAPQQCVTPKPSLSPLSLRSLDLSRFFFTWTLRLLSKWRYYLRIACKLIAGIKVTFHRSPFLSHHAPTYFAQLLTILACAGRMTRSFVTQPKSIHKRLEAYAFIISRFDSTVRE